jgi:tRNA(Ile)-lysidine synthase
VLEFAAEYCLQYCTDSSNETDDFLRNRLRHHVMPLLKQENPCFAENTSAMALRLRQDEQALGEAAAYDTLPDVYALRQLPKAVRSRMLERFLKENGVKEPEASHISLAESLIFSEKPSAEGHFPGGVTICRNYDRLEKKEDAPILQTVPLFMGVTQIPGYRITCAPAQNLENTQTVFTVVPQGGLFLRCRQPSDAIRLPGGTKTIKKVFIDRKIPAGQRLQIPVICDEAGILAVAEIGVNLDRKAEKLPAVQIFIEKLERKPEE